MMRRAAALALLAALALGAPAAGQDLPEAPEAAAPAPDGQPTGTIALGDDGNTDAAIATRIRSILAQLDGFEDVAVNVRAGIVTLSGEVVDRQAADRLEGLVGRVDGVVTIENGVTESTDVARRLDPVLTRIWARIAGAVAFLPLLAVALLAFAIIALAGVLLARLRRPWEALAPNGFIADIYRQLLRLAFVIVGIVVALDILGATALLGTVLGAAGLVGLAIGFAVRDTVENFIASVMLSFRQPFRPNDLIEIDGDMGHVIRLTSRATVLMSLDGNQIRVPNATVFKARIVNYSANRERRFQFEIGVASDADLAAVRELARSTLDAAPFILDEPPPAVWIDRIGDGAIFLQVTGWVDQTATGFLRARGESLRLVKSAIEAAGVEVPDTTYRVQLLGGGFKVTETDEGPAPAPAARPPAPADPTAAMETDNELAATRALSRIVAGERASDRPDLLDRAAPTE